MVLVSAGGGDKGLILGTFSTENNFAAK